MLLKYGLRFSHGLFTFAPMPRPYLYVLVTDYPYGIGEPFFETELFELSPLFQHIYLVIPEAHRANRTQVRFRLPPNASLVEMLVHVGPADKLRALLSLFGKPARHERKAILGSYRQKLDLAHWRIFTGFQAQAYAFERAFRKVLHHHGHPPEQCTLYSYWFTYATAALASIRSNSAYKAVTRIHGWDCFFERNPLHYLPMRPFVFEQLDGIYPISQAGLRYTLEKVPQAKGKVHCAYLGIQALPEPPDWEPRKHHLHLVSIAFIDPVKQLHRIAEALKEMHDIPVHWTHIGNAPNHSTQFETQTRELLAGRAQVSVTFTGEWTKEQIFAFLHQERPDALVCTSRSEGLPVSMMEAMGHGIPVISVDVGGISEIVRDGENGRLLPSDIGATALAQVFREFHALDAAKRISMARMAYATYNAYFSAPKNYRNFGSEALQ